MTTDNPVTAAPHRCNRVTPFGTREAVAERGLFMGNRGNLRRPDGTLKVWHARGWVCCLTSFRGRRLELDAPGRYTPLFFMDEAVALAAGHRPCGECRHADYQAFKAAWRRAFDMPVDAPLPVAQIDRALHAARVRHGRQVLSRAPLRALPTGTFVTCDGAPDHALLVREGQLHRWSHAGYGPAPWPGADAQVTVLTPAPTGAVLRAGYRPRLADIAAA